MEAPWSRAEEWDGSVVKITAFGERNGDVGGCSPTQISVLVVCIDGGKMFKSYNAGVCTVVT